METLVGSVLKSCLKENAQPENVVPKSIAATTSGPAVAPFRPAEAPCRPAEAPCHVLMKNILGENIDWHYRNRYTDCWIAQYVGYNIELLQLRVYWSFKVTEYCIFVH